MNNMNFKSIMINSRKAMRGLLVVSFLLVALGSRAQTIIYVDSAVAGGTNDGTSWSNAYVRLSDAFKEFNAGVGTTQYEVHIAKGTYYPTGAQSGTNRDSTFLFSRGGVKLMGAYLAGTDTRDPVLYRTVLSGDINVPGNNTDNSYHVIVLAGTNTAPGGIIIDRLFITKGNANTSSNYSYNGVNVYREMGGGINNKNSSSILSITNCIFSENYAGYGGGIHSLGSSPIVLNCIFSNNTAFAAGGMYNESSSPIVTNTIFSGNTTTGGSGGGMFNFGPSAPKVTNCVFTGNTVGTGGDGGGIFASTNALPKIYNCTFFKNSPNGLGLLSSSSGVNILKNSIVWDAISGSYTATNTLVKATAVVTAGQLFQDTLNLIGTDNIWGTADDGLQLLPCAPAVNGGNNDSIPAGITNDVTGNPRIQFSKVDMGAYEAIKISSAAATGVVAQNVSVNAYEVPGSTIYYALKCDTLIATISSSSTDTNAIKGSTTVKAWIEAVTPHTFVSRHYEITPVLNPGTATGFVTLYFRQSEFDSFNVYNSTKLPLTPGDALGIANLQVLKIGGTSSNGTGLPSSYPGAASTIDPDDLNIVWNSTYSRWEVSFAVTGFSGFFVKTQSSDPLPIGLASFSGYRAEQSNHLSWKVSEEKNIQAYELQRSEDARHFVTITTLTNAGLGQYNYTDKDFYTGIRYYRLKLKEDNSDVYSNTVALATGKGSSSFSLYPNPAEKSFTIFTDKPALLPNTAIIYDATGRLVKSFVLEENKQVVDISNLPAGLYTVQITNGDVLKFVKK